MNQGGIKKLTEGLQRDKVELLESEFVVYRGRWIILFCIVAINMGCFLIGVCLAPVATYATKYYEISGDEIDLISLVSWSVNIPGLWLALYFIGRFKLLTSIRIASSLVLVGSLIRALSTMPIQAYDDAVPRKVQFWITFVGQLIIATGHPMLMTMSTQTSQVWFGEHERMISTPILALAPFFGSILGQGLSSLIVSKDPERIPYLNIVTIALVVIGTLCSWIFLDRAAPATPPSRSAALLMNQPAMSLKEVYTSAIKIIKNKTILFIGICFGGGGGLSHTVATQLNQLMCSRNYSVGQSTIAAVVNLSVGFTGAILINFVAKRIGKTTEIAKTCYAMACLFVVMFSVAVVREGAMAFICIGLAGFGFFGIAAYPMALELAAEATYPLDASMSESWVHVNVQFASVVLVLIGNSLFWDLPEGSVNQCSKEVGIEGGVEARDYTPYSYMIMCQAVVTTIIVIAFIRPKLLRSAEDNKRKMSRDSDLV